MVEKCLNRRLIPSIVLIDAGYGNNSSLLNELEEKKLTYIGGIAKNRNVSVIKNGQISESKRIDEVAKLLEEKDYKIREIKDVKLWVALVNVEIEKLSGQKTIAIVMNANSLEKATEIDYLITNKKLTEITEEWIVKKYGERN